MSSASINKTHGIDLGKEYHNRNTKRKYDFDKKNKKGWNHNLNIPYYRKIMKRPFVDLKNELENLVSPQLDLLKGS